MEIVSADLAENCPKTAKEDLQEESTVKLRWLKHSWLVYHGSFELADIIIFGII